MGTSRPDNTSRRAEAMKKITNLALGLFAAKGLMVVHVSDLQAGVR